MICQALGGRARAAFNYTVTLAVQVAEPVNLGPLVAKHGLDVILAIDPDRLPEDK